MLQLFSNNAKSTLVADISSGDTALTLQPGHGALFPSPVSPNYCILTLTQAGSETSWEAVKLTSRSGDVLTVVRGYEGSAAAWVTGDKVELRITAKFLNDVGYIGIPQIIKSTDYTFTLGEVGCHILHPAADTTARGWVIPSNATVPYPIGTSITMINQYGAGPLTISIMSDTMRFAGTALSGPRTLSASGIATAVKITATEWIISGVGLT